MEEQPTVDAVRWLRRSYRAGAAVDALAAVGMAVPASYGPTLRFSPEFDRGRAEFAYALRTGAPLMAGWTVLLMWADRKPMERRGVLPITIALLTGRPPDRASPGRSRGDDARSAELISSYPS